MSYSGPTDLFIDGEWIEAGSGETFSTEDPATEDPYATIAQAAEADVDRAVSAAADAVERGSDWRSLDPRERGRRLDAMADAIESMSDEIIRHRFAGDA